MNDLFIDYLKKYPDPIQDLFNHVYQILTESIDEALESILWAKLPSFYLNDHFVRLIPFKDHLNIEASAIIDYKESLSDYKITPKGMLQIYLNQPVPEQLLKIIFEKTLLDI